MASRRRGPRADVDVPTVLLDTAERMLGTQPRELVSLRAIAREAGVAPAALSHHFADRDDLIGAVIARRLPGVVDSTSARLIALIEQDTPVSIESVIAASLDPLIDVVNADPVGGFHWLRLFSDLALTGSPVWRRAILAQTNLYKLYVVAASRAMPNLTDIDVRRRTSIALYSALALLANADRGAWTNTDGAGWGRGPLGTDGLDPLFVEQLLVFTSAGLAAVPSQPQRRPAARRPTKRRATKRQTTTPR